MKIKMLIARIREDTKLRTNNYVMLLCDEAEQELKDLEHYKNEYLKTVPNWAEIDELAKDMFYKPGKEYVSQHSDEFLEMLSTVGPADDIPDFTPWMEDGSGRESQA